MVKDAPAGGLGAKLPAPPACGPNFRREWAHNCLELAIRWIKMERAEPAYGNFRRVLSVHVGAESFARSTSPTHGK